MKTAQTRDGVDAASQARQAELFADLVDQALTRDEVIDGLSAAPGIDAEYLRTRCRLCAEELWTDVTEAAATFDEAAERHDRTRERTFAASAFHRLLTSPPAQRKMALLGLGLCVVAFFLRELGPRGAFPHVLLLFLASGLILLNILDSLVVRLIWWATRQHRRPTTQERRWWETILSAMAACLFLAAIISVLPAPAVNGDRTPGSASGSLLTSVTLVGILFALSFMRYSPSPDAHPTPLRVNGFRSLTVASGAFLPLIVALARNNDSSRLVTTAQPDIMFLTGGFALIALAALLTLAGLGTQPAAVIKTAYLRARHDVESQLTDRAILPLLRTEINNNSQSYDVHIRVDEASGLGELSDPIYKVRTTASDHVATLLKTMPGGSIGLAGARGCGKTTLMESYCAGNRTDTGTLAVMVSAPVEYSPREFLLHLYAKICQEALGPNGATPPSLDPLTRLHRRRRILAMSVGTLGLTAVGIFLLVAPGLELNLSTPQLWGLAMLLLGFLLTLQLSSSAWIPRPSQDIPSSLTTLAAERLEEIRFQQAFTATWTGSVKAPVGLGAALGGGRSLTRQQMHLPEIVDSLRTFLETAAGEHRVLIGIDELDKMRTERAAEQFLNDIKGIFGVRSCYYLVSVSEDAMVGFERRGMPFRDVFDSTFDEIVWFDPLTPAEAVAAIDRRVVGMPMPFKLLCHALAGGLPRDLVRVARAVLNAQNHHQESSEDIHVNPTDLSVVVTRLVTDDVIRKTRAIAVAAHRIDLEPDVSRFLLVCERVGSIEINSASLHNQVTEITQTETSLLSMDTTREAVSMLLRLRCELACYYYYSATLCEFFNSGAPTSHWHTALHEEDVLANLGLLAKARHTFALNTRVAWEVISTFRKAWRLHTEPFPVDLV